MGIYYNPTIPSIRNLIVGYAANNPKSYTGNYVRSIFGNGLDIPTSGGTLTSGFLYLNDSSELSGSPDLSLNSYTQLSFVVTANCNSSEGDKKGHLFGYSQGSEYLAASTIITSDTPGVITTTSTSTVADSYNPSTSTIITSDTPGVITTTSTSTVADSYNPSTSTTITTDTPGIITTTSTSTVADSYNPSTSTTITTDTPGIITTIITGTQSATHLPVNEISFKFDRGSRGVYARIKSYTTDISISTRFIPSSTGDNFCIIYERTPFNKLSLYINGVLSNTLTSTQSLSSFPSGNNGIHYGSNGVGSDNFEGGMGSLYIYNKVLTTDEIVSLSRTIR